MKKMPSWPKRDNTQSTSSWGTPWYQALLPVFETHYELNRVMVPILLEPPKRYKEAIIIQWIMPKVQTGES